MTQTEVAYVLGPQFAFGKTPLQTFTLKREVWFLASDVCAAIGHSSPARAVERLDPDEHDKALLPSASGDQWQVIISESGLYHLVLTSRKSGAKPFRRWVTSEVLPSIRLTGSYAHSRSGGSGQDETSTEGQRLSEGERKLIDAVRRSGRYVAIKKPGRDVWFEPQAYATIASDMADTELRGLIASAHVTLAVWDGIRRLDGALDQGKMSEGFYARLDNAIRLNASLADTLLVWRNK